MIRNAKTTILASILMLCLSACGVSGTPSAEGASMQTAEKESTASESKSTADSTAEENTDSSIDSGTTAAAQASTNVGDEKEIPKKSEEAEGDVYVEPVEGLSDDFYRGVDISSYASLINSGAVFRDEEGQSLDGSEFMKELKDAGINYVRIRLWNDPFDDAGHGYGGGNCDLDNAILLGQMATEAGMKVLIDFHYSDFWADPNRQLAPKAWKDMDLDEKSEALGKFTADALTELIKSGVDVGMVQVGNETVSGIAGETSEDAMCRLFSAGAAAVRSTAKTYDKDILVALHFTDPQKAGKYKGYAKMLKDHDVDYDVFASSYYPYWHGTTENLTNVLNEIAADYGKKVMVAETSYPYTSKDGDGYSNSVNEDSTGVDFAYDISVQGQADEVRDVIAAVNAVENNAGIGVFYWEPAWLPVEVYDADAYSSAVQASAALAETQKKWEKYGAGWATSYASAYDPANVGDNYGGCAWDNQAMFDFNGYALPSLNVFRYVYEGNEVAKTATGIETVSVDATAGASPELPESVTVKFNTGETKEAKVTWNEDEIKTAVSKGEGTYKITGTVEGYEDINAVCSLTMEYKNLLTNPGFEDKDTAMWTLGGSGADIQNDATNARTGDYALHFWKDAAFTYTAEQTITVEEAGTYRLSAYFEGGDADDSTFTAYVIIDGKKTEATVSAKGWAAWQNALIKDICVAKEGTKITVGVEGDCNSGAWGTWDDISFARTGDVK